MTRGGDSLLLLLRLLLGLLGVGDDEVNGIFGLLQQNSQFCLNLLRPGTEGGGGYLLLMSELSKSSLSRPPNSTN